MNKAIIYLLFILLLSGSATAYYNTTNLTEADNLYEMTYEVNMLSGGLIGVFILVAFFLITFMVYKLYENDTKEVLLVDSVLTTIVAVLMWTIQLINWTIIIYPIVLIFATLMIYLFSD